MARCVIVCAGPGQGERPALEPDDFIIACDGGLHTAKALGLIPHLIVGDFDSYTGPLPEGIAVVRLKAEKDDTDSMAAIKIGLERGFTDFFLLNALGGRLDHTLGNLQGLIYLAERGAAGVATGCGDRAALLHAGRMELTGWPGRYVSALAVGGPARGVSTEGLYYPLCDATLEVSFPLGVSNRFVGDTAAFSVVEGCLLIVLPAQETPR